MSGYLHFQKTGVKSIDNIAGALRNAGNAFHHTDQWGETIDWLTTPQSYIEIIQQALNEAALAQATPGWTKEAPKVPGWYWWRRLKGDRTVEFVVVIEIVNIHGKLFMSDTGDCNLSYFASEKFKNGVHKNEWSSQPLAPPGGGT